MSTGANRDCATSAAGWRAQRRARILEAAAKQFAERAYALVQMDDIARAAGVGKPTIYRYFPSKEELYLEIFDRALTALIARIQIYRGQALPPRETIAAIIAAILETFSLHIGTLRSMFADEADLADRIRRVFRGRRREINVLLSGALQDGLAAGEFRELDLNTTPGILVGMCWGGIMGAPTAKPSVLAHTICTIFLEGACRIPQGHAAEMLRPLTQTPRLVANARSK